MSESSTRFCPFCGAEIQLDPTSSGTGNAGGIKASTILKGVGVAIAVPCAAATLAGFGAGGIVAGSVATMWQASVGNVAAGSAFATLQSIGATGGFYSGLAYGGTAFGAGKWWEIKNNSSNEEGNNEEDGNKGGDGGERKHGNGENKNSSDRTESEPNDGGGVEEVSLTCPQCERSFRISMSTAGSTTTDDDVQRIAQ
mmetsp:Transcript_41079/g.99013  ORF Transcript_41079/g.99013 Transcript_41079/m.99013 type:complete len:198 (-) Transcript_41079:234-827(-)|eukprot:CAMPEP_0113625062 /NCGR_PEP_ID=MMETSP0017_2-20120614/12937_1 /TAXON_ID=2856 /ORGANISM="Cylindrotheca closterium" /LENGTH=197 /DNA_ID=CAMNT_0000535147 /DNA_START=55 /DNA_END=648 /DNA_ORIENTATION=- /assembly_acc=CAM_ASM_000147